MNNKHQFILTLAALILTTMYFIEDNFVICLILETIISLFTLYKDKLNYNRFLIVLIILNVLVSVFVINYYFNFSFSLQFILLIITYNLVFAVYGNDFYAENAELFSLAMVYYIGFFCTLILIVYLLPESITKNIMYLQLNGSLTKAQLYLIFTNLSIPAILTWQVNWLQIKLKRISQINPY